MDSSFDRALQGVEETGGSTSDKRLVEHLARHGKDEGAMLERYQHFADTSPSAATRYLVKLLMEDEHRHHRILAEIANAAAWGWGDNSPEPAVPDLHGHAAETPEMVAATRELLAAEEEDKRELDRLKHELKPYADTTLWALLVDLMILDTEKHARILRFILEHGG
jgi:hypothetical protein